MQNYRDFTNTLGANTLGDPQGGFGSHRKRSFLQQIHIDGPLLLLLLILITVGLFVLNSASNQDSGVLIRQISRIVAGFVCIAAIAQVKPATLQRWAPWCYAGGVALLIGVILFGSQSKGAQRWLDLPGLPRFQPSEAMKLALPMMISAFLAKRALPPSLFTLLFTLILIAIPVALVAKQPDLGTSLLIGSSGLLVLLLGGLSITIILIFAALSIPSALVLWFYYMHDYQRQRVLTFLNPESDPLGAGWNIIQSTTAIGSGGLNGKGWLNGTQSHLDFLPESSTDFIIAVLAEEFGLIGVVCILMIYLLILARGLFISFKAQDRFSQLLAATINYTFFIYVFVNIGMVSGLLPIVGVPLPLVSYGGTSIVTLLCGFGLLMSIHTHKKMIT